MSPRPEVAVPAVKNGPDDRSEARRFRSVVDAVLDASTGHRTEELRDSHRPLSVGDEPAERFAHFGLEGVELPRNGVRQS